MRICLIILEPVQNLSTHVWLASFPPYFAKILGNTQSIPCGFGCIWRKNLQLLKQRAPSAHAEILNRLLGKELQLWIKYWQYSKTIPG